MTAIDLDFQLISLKQALEDGNYSPADCAALKSLLVQGWLYQRVAAVPALCEPAVQRAAVDLAKLVMSCVPPAALNKGVDLSLRLKPRSSLAPADQLPPSVTKMAESILGHFLVELVSEVHAAITALSMLAKDIDAEAKEHLLYAIGMAEVTAQNLGHLQEEFKGLDEKGLVRVEQFVPAAITFIAALKTNIASLSASEQT